MLQIWAFPSERKLYFGTSLLTLLPVIFSRIEYTSHQRFRNPRSFDLTVLRHIALDTLPRPR